MRRPHRHRPTPAYRASIGTTRIGNHACTTGLHLEPRPSGITLPVTRLPHNELSYHALHNAPSAQRAFIPHRHNGLLHNGVGTTRLQDARFATSGTKRECHLRRHGCRTGCRLAAASAGDTCQKANDRVREAVGYSGVLGRYSLSSRIAMIRSVYHFAGRDSCFWSVTKMDGS